MSATLELLLSVDLPPLLSKGVGVEFFPQIWCFYLRSPIVCSVMGLSIYLFSISVVYIDGLGSSRPPRDRSTFVDAWIWIRVLELGSFALCLFQLVVPLSGLLLLVVVDGLLPLIWWGFGQSFEVLSLGVRCWRVAL